MKKTIICNIPMKEHVDLSVYTSNDQSLPVSDKEVRYPITAFLQETLKPEDEVDILLIVKNDNYGHFEKNTRDFCQEFEEINATIGAKFKYSIINSKFEETKATHEQLLGSIVEELSVDSHIIADVTYGPKDLLVVLFTAFNFAEKFLNCTVENIVYGQANFENGKAVNTKICDMIPLYCLGSVTDLIRCDDPAKAKAMLKMLISA